MPLWKFRELADAEAHLDTLPTTAETSLRTALFLLTLSEAQRRGVRTALLGLHRYADHQEAETARERHALRQLRESGAAQEPKGQVTESAGPRAAPPGAGD